MNIDRLRKPGEIIHYIFYSLSEKVKDTIGIGEISGYSMGEKNLGQSYIIKRIEDNIPKSDYDYPYMLIFERNIIKDSYENL